jgi:hypothetical protein
VPPAPLFIAVDMQALIPLWLRARAGLHFWC